MRNKTSLLCQLASAFLLVILSNAQAQPTTTGNSHVLKPTPKTVAWGYYAATTPPVLRIKSGDTVEAHTLITSTPPRLESAGVKPDKIEPALREIFTTVTDKGPGGHILTGPIYIEGAEIGDVLEVRIQSIKLAIPYAYTAFRPGAGFLPEDFSTSQMKIIPLDEKRMMGRFSDNIEIPLRPFFGSMGVAPPAASGRISSAPPGIHAGNLDSKNWSQAQRFSSPFIRPAHCSKSATVTPPKATAKSASPRWKPRWSASCNSSCERI